jgi:DNA-binding IclR family transcriptional regulator
VVALERGWRFRLRPTNLSDNKRLGAGHPAKNVKVKLPGERRSLSRSATRALDVLELFGEARRPLRAIEMAKSLGLHPSSMNQLLKTMVESAHLTFEAHFKTHLPSPRLAQFSAWMLASYGADERLRHLLRKLNAASAEIVTLTTPNDLFMQVLDVVGAEATVETTGRGLRVSIFGSTTGAAYLSTLPTTEIERLAKRARICDSDVSAILAHAARVRTAGLADGPSVGGQYWSIATPLPVGVSPAPLILGLAGPVDRIKRNLAQLQQLMRDTVERWRAERSATVHARGGHL